MDGRVESGLLPYPSSGNARMLRTGWNSAFFSAALAAFLLLAGAGAHGQTPASAVSRPALPAASPAAPKGQLVVLDHVVAVINGDVILESDVQEEIHFAVLQSDRADPARNTAQRALQRLIDRDLILQQMKATRAQITPPGQQQIEDQLLELRRQIPECAQFHCETDAGWSAFLAAHNLTEAEVAKHWGQRMLILSFIQSRFGAGIRISQVEITQYYDKDFVPEFTKRHLKAPSLDAVSTRIKEILLQQHVNTFLQDWLQSLKDEGSVSILSAAYSDVGNPTITGDGSSEEQP